MSKNTLKILVPRPELSYRMTMHTKIVSQACNFKCSNQHIRISKGTDLNDFNFLTHHVQNIIIFVWNQH